MQVTAVSLKLRGELHNQGMIDLVGSGTSTGARATNCIVCGNELVDLGLANGPPTLQRWRRLICSSAF
jgi:hypothetical protein